MLSKEELASLRQLLESADTDTLDLGLAILEQNKSQVRGFLPILVCQQELRKHKNLATFLKQHSLPDDLYEWEEKLKLLRWALSGKIWLSDAKKRNPKSYETAKIEFLDILDEIEPTLLKSSELEELYANLSSHFMYNDNDYILATHFSAALYKRFNGYKTMVELGRLLVYYHFPNGSLLKLRAPMSAWINTFKSQCLSNVGKKWDEWHYFFICWLEGLLDEAAGERAKTQQNYLNLLAWADERPHLLDSGEQIYGDIYQNLSCWAAESGDLKKAKFYYKKLKVGAKEKRFLEAKANVLILENKTDKAIAVLFEGIKNRPITESYYVKLAEIYAAQGKFGQAAETMINCIEHSPQYKIHIIKLLEYLSKTNFHSKSEVSAHYEKVIADIDSSIEELEVLFE